MAINVACPSCGRQYNVKDEAAGKRFKCKDCESVVDVPAAGAGDDFGGDDYGEPYDPYGGAPSGDAPPPAAPARRRKSSSGAGAAAVTARTMPPAIFMYIICGMSICYGVFNTVANALGLQGDLPNFGGPQDEAAQKIGQVIGAAMVFLFIFRDLFLIYAFSRMHVAKSYGIAYAGAVISVIPCLGSPCCALGIPFGIWSLVILNDPAIKAAFR
jgi:hypothetical protein